MKGARPQKGAGAQNVSLSRVYFVMTLCSNASASNRLCAPFLDETKSMSQLFKKNSPSPSFRMSRRILFFCVACPLSPQSPQTYSFHGGLFIFYGLKGHIGLFTPQVALAPRSLESLESVDLLFPRKFFIFYGLKGKKTSPSHPFRCLGEYI